MLFIKAKGSTPARLMPLKRLMKSRPALWCKLIDLKLSPAITLAVVNYYKDSYMVLQIGDTFSKLFKTTTGVRQGGVMSPKLFSIYIEDLLVEVDDCE